MKETGAKWLHPGNQQKIKNIPGVSDIEYKESKVIAICNKEVEDISEEIESKVDIVEVEDIDGNSVILVPELPI